MFRSFLACKLAPGRAFFLAISLALALALATFAAPVLANRVQVDSWDHGAWHLSLQENPDFPGFTSCVVWTGSDGNGVLSIQVGDGGADASLRYVPVAPRGMPSPLTHDDSVVLMVDGAMIPVSAALEIFELQNEYGEWEVSADVTNTYVAETVLALRAGDVMTVGVIRNGAMTIYETYALNGFTATWLKAAEWCGFDPNRQFRTL